MINMILLPESQNTKTGNILQSYSSPPECRLCSRDRESVVLFEVHGQSKGKALRVIQIKRA